MTFRWFRGRFGVGRFLAGRKAVQAAGRNLHP